MWNNFLQPNLLPSIQKWRGTHVIRLRVQSKILNPHHSSSINRDPSLREMGL